MKKILMIASVLVVMNGVSLAAVSPVIISSSAAITAANSAATARAKAASKEAQKSIEADSFISCSQEDGECRKYIENGGCSSPYRLVSIREFLEAERPGSVYKGFSYDSYYNEIYIYYNGKQEK